MFFLPLSSVLSSVLLVKQINVKVKYVTELVFPNFEVQSGWV
jgi:hypothetical protein